MFKPFVLIAVLALLVACAPTPQPAPTPSITEEARPVRTSVTDLAAFDAFIAGHPSPEALRAQYPGLTVVMPGDITTKELRMDHSRYFVELDAEGRVIGGRFQ